MSAPGRMDNARWRAAKAATIRNQQGLCALCTEPLVPGLPKGDANATEVDHIVPLSQGGEPYATTNLRALHQHCHKRLTRQQFNSRPRADACAWHDPVRSDCPHVWSRDWDKPSPGAPKDPAPWSEVRDALLARRHGLRWVDGRYERLTEDES